MTLALPLGNGTSYSPSPSPTPVCLPLYAYPSTITLTRRTIDFSEGRGGAGVAASGWVKQQVYLVWKTEAPHDLKWPTDPRKGDFLCRGREILERFFPANLWD